MWIARDSDGSLWLYNTKPVKDESVWLLPNSMGECCNIESDSDFFSEIKWEDKEPRELVLKPIKEE